MKKHRILSNMLETQKSNRDLIMSSVLLAVAVNLLSTGIAEAVGNCVLILAGVVVCICVIVWNFYTKLRNATNSINLEGLFIYDEKNHELVEVHNYPINEDLVKYLRAACTENKAIEKKWKNGTLAKYRIKHKKSADYDEGYPEYTGDLLIELLEYCIIHRLSMHLSSYFTGKYEKEHISTLNNTDVPDVLLKNRFLKLFTEDMDNRAEFACSDVPMDKNAKGTVVMAVNASGAMYQRLELTLPKGSRVSRKSKNQLLIDTPILSMTIESVFEGFSTVVPTSFERIYVGIDNHFDYNTYKFYINVDVKFKPKVLFSKEKKRYYAWVDSFMDELEEYVSKEKFFQKINWNVVECVLRSISQKRRRDNSEGPGEKSKVVYTVVKVEDTE